MGILDSFSKMLSGGRTNIDRRFELLRTAVSGSMSQFHMARDRKTDQVVGLKLLDIEKTTFFEGRFKGLKKPSEGEIAVQMDHPNIVKTLEHGVTSDGQAYIVMEFLEGQGMNSLIIAKNEKLIGRRLPLLLQAAEALGYVHQQGFIHRDVCPRNFVISKDAKTTTLIDFGLTVPATELFMQPGNRTGTPNYMAPEIVRRRRTDRRVDVFAFGVTAYAFMAYELPWPGAGASGKAAMNHDTKPPEPIEKHFPDIHPKLGAAIMACMSADPSARPAEMEEFLSAIKGVKSETR